MLKPRKGGFTLYYEEACLDIVKSLATEKPQAPQLFFIARSADRIFPLITEAAPEKSENIFYFTSAKARKLRQSKRSQFLVSEKNSVSESDYTDAESLVREEVLSQLDLLVKPAFVFTVDMKRFRTITAIKAEPNFLIRFNAKRTVWKYYLLSQKRSAAVYINDLDKQQEFTFGGDEWLTDNRQAKTYFSKKPLVLSEKSSYRFQLKEKGESGERVLLSRLPLASGELYGKTQINGKYVTVSEIYVNY